MLSVIYRKKTFYVSTKNSWNCLNKNKIIKFPNISWNIWSFPHKKKIEEKLLRNWHLVYWSKDVLGLKVWVRYIYHWCMLLIPKCLNKGNKIVKVPFCFHDFFSYIEKKRGRYSGGYEELNDFIKWFCQQSRFSPLEHNCTFRIFQWFFSFVFKTNDVEMYFPFHEIFAEKDVNDSEK